MATMVSSPDGEPSTMTNSEELSLAERSRLALALDIDELSSAMALARRLAPYFAIAKVGLELFSAAGPAAVEQLRGEGFAVFVDLKLHDIPTTAGRAAAALARLGASYVTVHTAGGLAMCTAAAQGLAIGAAEAGEPLPVGLGVTVLTSDPEASEALLASRAGLAAAAGLGGLVCAAPDLAVVRRAAPGLLTVVPGTRPSWAATDDQARVASPAEAITAGADVLVIGRAVTHAADPLAAAEALHRDLLAG